MTQRSSQCFVSWTLILPYLCVANHSSFYVSGSGILELLQYREKRTIQKEGNIEDIFDGKLYKKHFDDRGFFHGTPTDRMQDELHISLQINTDGVAIFRSSKFSLWPIYCTVNELPPGSR